MGVVARVNDTFMANCGEGGWRIYHGGGWWWMRNDKWQYKWLWNWMGQWWPESTVHLWQIVGKVGGLIRVVVVVVVGEKWQVATKWAWNLLCHG